MHFEKPVIHEIYKRLAELVAQDFENLDKLEDIIDSAIEYADDAEQIFLTQAMNQARKERLLVELGKELLGVNEEPEEADEEAMSDPLLDSRRLHVTRTQLEIMKKLMEENRKWNSEDEPNYPRF
jgi:hypothetical protein